MKKKRIPKKTRKRARLQAADDDPLRNHARLESLKKHIEKLWDYTEKAEDRLQDIEIHMNLLTRLLTTICVERFGMRIGVLKRLIKRVEKEAIRDSQILHLESLYKLPPLPDKKSSSSPHSPSRNDPWEEIS